MLSHPPTEQGLEFLLVSQNIFLQNLKIAGKIEKRKMKGVDSG